MHWRNGIENDLMILQKRKIVIKYKTVLYLHVKNNLGNYRELCTQKISCFKKFGDI